MIARQSPPPGDPGNTALYNPSSRQRLKASRLGLLLVRRRGLACPLGSHQAPHYLHVPSKGLFEPVNEAASIMAISPEKLHAGQHRLQWLKHLLSSLQIGGLGPCHLDFQKMALRIYQHVSLAPPDFFSPYQSPFEGLERHWF